MNNTECPSAVQLNHYVTGRLALDAHEAIDQHLDACEACLQATEKLDENSRAFVFGFPHVAAEPAIKFDPELRQLVDRAKALGSAAFRRRETSAFGETLPCSGVQFASGTTLGNYVLDETVGGGNMGFVFRAYHKRMKRDVALKFISPQLTRSAEARKRFQREIEAVAKLNHPNIVAAYDADEVDGYCFLVLELIKGRDLREVLRRDGPLSVKQALAYIRDAAAGLAHAHEVGIIHRDVKSSNLLLDEQGVVKVLDLGLARIQFAGDKSLNNEVTQTGDLAGTPAYMSPEQWSGIQEADCRSDIYSLGCTLYQLLTGQPLFGDRSTIEMALAHRDETPPSICDSRSDCPHEVDALFKSMVSKRPEDRPQSMQQIVTEIETLLAKLERGELVAKVHRHDTRHHTAIWIIATVAATIVIALSLGQLLPKSSETGTSLNVSAADAEPQENREVAVEVETPSDAELPQKPIEGGNQADANRINAEPSNTSNNIDTQQIEPQPEVPLAPQIELVRIAPGRFTMGSPASDMTSGRDEKPAHVVEITKPFMIGKFEITVEQYTDVMGTGVRQSQPNQTEVSRPASKLPNRSPIAGISWHDAIRFCNLLSKRHGLIPYYTVEDKTVSVRRASNGFRLPTEAEWEFACRANAQTRWHFGDDEKKLAEFAWYAKNSGGKLHAVGSKKPNSFGLHDMHGNVPEWCWDRYDPEYYAESEAIDPPGSSRGTRRVFRGGGANNRAAQTRSAVRSPLGMSYGFLNNVGLRVARSVAE